MSDINEDLLKPVGEPEITEDLNRIMARIEALEAANDTEESAT